MVQLNVKKIRADLELTQAQLAALVGVDQSTVSNWENGQQPRGPAKLLLARLVSERAPTRQNTAA